MLEQRGGVDFGVGWFPLYACKQLEIIEADRERWLPFTRRVLTSRDHALRSLKRWLPKLRDAYHEAIREGWLFGAPIPTDVDYEAMGRGLLGNETTQAISTLIGALKTDAFFNYKPLGSLRRSMSGWSSQIRHKWKPRLGHLLEEAGIPRRYHAELTICAGLQPYKSRRSLSRKGAAKPDPPAEEILCRIDSVHAKRGTVTFYDEGTPRTLPAEGQAQSVLGRIAAGASGGRAAITCRYGNDGEPLAVTRIRLS